MVAFHFPPYGASSGVQRTACFARYLPRFGWGPCVLTASTHAYDAVTTEQVDYVGDLTRVFALDTVRHLGIAGKYPGFLALPDRWVSWLPFALLSGLWLIRKHRPSVIWSTYPIATTHLIGYALRRLTGLPWVADFRDPMIDEVHPSGDRKRATYSWIEKKTVKHASVCCFTTSGAMQNYLASYPALTEGRCRVLGNGYDEQDFINLPANRADSMRHVKLRLLHSGALYSLERDPSCFFEALAILSKKNVVSARSVEILLRGTGNENRIRQLASQYGINNLIRFLPLIEHKKALAEMYEVDGLLLLQAANCNQQIPAKTYEYLRSGKPLFAMTDRQGETAQLLNSVGVDSIAALDDTQEIVQKLERYLEILQQKNGTQQQIADVGQFSRERKTAELAEILNQFT